MRRTALLLAAAVMGATLPGTAAFAAPAPKSSTGSLSQQLAQEEAQLTKLNNEVETAQGRLDLLNRQLAADQAQQARLTRQLDELARLEYQEPVLTLSTILSADTLSQLLTNISQARLVAARQQTLLSRADRLRTQDQKARDQAAAQLAQIKAARDAAAAVADRTMAELAAAQASLRSQVQNVAAQAAATAGKPLSQPPAGSWPNHFAFGYCTWYVATRRYVPWYGNAIEWWPNARAYGYPEGQTPEVGAIMVEDLSAYGHVAYVTAVHSDGSWTVAEMNYYGWDVVDTRTLRPGQDPVIGFIYG